MTVRDEAVLVPTVLLNNHRRRTPYLKEVVRGLWDELRHGSTVPLSTAEVAS